MRLAEALLRVPDAETAIALTADQLGRADFDANDAEATGEHVLMDDERSAGSTDALADQILVPRSQASQIDHLDRDAITRDAVGRRDRFVDHP